MYWLDFPSSFIIYFLFTCPLKLSAKTYSNIVNNYAFFCLHSHVSNSLRSGGQKLKNKRKCSIASAFSTQTKRCHWLNRGYVDEFESNVIRLVNISKIVDQPVNITAALSFVRTGKLGGKIGGSSSSSCSSSSSSSSGGGGSTSEVV